MQFKGFLMKSIHFEFSPIKIFCLTFDIVWNWFVRQTSAIYVHPKYITYIKLSKTLRRTFKFNSYTRKFSRPLLSEQVSNVETPLRKVQKTVTYVYFVYVYHESAEWMTKAPPNWCLARFRGWNGDLSRYFPGKRNAVSKWPSSPFLRFCHTQTHLYLFIRLTYVLFRRSRGYRCTWLMVIISRQICFAFGSPLPRMRIVCLLGHNMHLVKACLLIINYARFDSMFWKVVC